MPTLNFIGTMGLESLEEWELGGGVEGGLESRVERKRKTEFRDSAGYTLFISCLKLLPFL
jgi:hypothetical protein